MTTADAKSFDLTTTFDVVHDQGRPLNVLKGIHYLALAGFRSVEKHELAHDIQNNWYVVRK